jgi:hypothetical protein
VDEALGQNRCGGGVYISGVILRLFVCHASVQFLWPLPDPIAWIRFHYDAGSNYLAWLAVLLFAVLPASWPAVAFYFTAAGLD